MEKSIEKIRGKISEKLMAATKRPQTKPAQVCGSHESEAPCVEVFLTPLGPSRPFPGLRSSQKGSQK